MQFDRLAPGAGGFAQKGRHNGLAVLIAFLTLAWAIPASAVCYVNGAASGGAGASWADAYNDLQSALTNAACAEVWVAQGVYKPAAAGQSVSFVVSPGVAVYGGFSGGEASRDARDPAAHATILSGDIDNNDASVGGVDADATKIAGANSRHVVVMDGTVPLKPVTSATVLDGFTVTGGDNTNSSVEGGGALWCKGSGTGVCSPTLARLVFSGNKAILGGALALDCHSGGTSSPTLSDITFSGNFATFFGGALYENAQLSGGTCNPALTNVVFSANTATTYGGAMFLDGGGTSSPTLTNVTFDGNAAANGGAMSVNSPSGTSSPSLTGVTFSGNHASGGDGGALYINASSTSSPILTNITFFGNSATGNGGAIYHHGNNGDFSLKLINVTITGNSANNAGAIYNVGDNSYPIMLDSIVWSDSAATSAPEFLSTGLGGVSVAYSIIQNGCATSNCSGLPANIYTGDPKLGALADNGGFTRTLMPGDGSAAIDALACGDSNEVPLTDQRGAVRPDSLSTGSTRCDLGAVEANSLPGDRIFNDRFGSYPWDEF